MLLFDSNIVGVGLWQLNMAECCIYWPFCAYPLLLSGQRPDAPLQVV